MAVEENLVEELLDAENDAALNGWTFAHVLGESLGMVATLCFTIQYAPQAYKNYERKSCRGFSSTGIIIKLVGAAFLMVNAYLLGEVSSVVLYGVFNVMQHSVFMVQFASYMEDTKFFAWLLFPLIPLTMGTAQPWTIPLTNMIKPGAQVFSHIPQLLLCYRMKTTSGVSLSTQHLNVVGGLCGMIMCFLIPPKSVMTYFLYTNSMMQALSLYVLAFWYDNFKLIGAHSQPRMAKNRSPSADSSPTTSTDETETFMSKVPMQDIEMRG